MPKSKKKVPDAPRRLGRPHLIDPAVRFAEKSYLVTTFRLNKMTVAQLETIKDALSLSTRTAALQFAAVQAFKALPRLGNLGEKEIATILRRHLKKVGGDQGV